MTKASSSPASARAKSPTASSGSGKVRNYRQSLLAPYIFVSPFFMLFLIFGIFPLCFTFYLSFNQWVEGTPWHVLEYVGLENYEFVLTDDRFHKSLWNTLYLAIASGAPQHLVAIPLAFFLHTSFKRWRNFTIAIYFLPYITSTVAISLVFGTLFSKDYGVINATLSMLAQVPGLGALFPSENISWLSDQYFIKPAVSFVVFWRYVGFNTVLYLAALQTIPSELYEAAAMDGASKWRQFWHITLPLLRPMMLVAVILTVIGNLQLFDEPRILLGGYGGTKNAGMTTAMYVYQSGFVENERGFASAMAWVLFAIIAFFTWLTQTLFVRGGMNDALQK